MNVKELRRAIEHLADSAPTAIEIGGTLKPLVVEDRNGTAVMLEEKISTGPNPDPPKPPTSQRRKPWGLFALQAGGQSQTDRSFPRGGMLISLNELKDSDLTGKTIRFQYDHVYDRNKKQWIESGWKQIADDIATVHKADKIYTLLAMSGELPVNAESLDIYNRIDIEVARRFLSDNRFAQYHVTGVSNPGASEELHWNTGMSQTNIDAMIARVKHARKHLPGVTLAFPIGGGPRNEASIRKILEGIKDVDDIILKHNALMAWKANNPATNTFDKWANISQNKFLVECCKKYPNIRMGFEMARASVYNLPGTNLPAQGSRDINDSIRQGVNQIKRAGEDPTKTYIAIYGPDIPTIKASTLTE